MSGRSIRDLGDIIAVGGLDLDEQGRIERESLWDFLEADLIVAHWGEADA